MSIYFAKLVDMIYVKLRYHIRSKGDRNKVKIT